MMKPHRRACLCAALLIALNAYSEPSPGLGITDWPHWRGLGWDGKSAEMQWSPALLKAESVAWTAEIGPGYSSVAVVGGMVYAVGGRAGQETASCLDAGSGKTVWKVTLPAARGRFSGDGMQSTPTVEGGRLWFLTPGGVVFCLSAKAGAILWSTDLVSDLGIDLPLWYLSGSVRITGALAVVNAGGAGIALDKDTGKVVWKNLDGQSGYSTPVVFSAEGVECIALSTLDGLQIVRADTGKILVSFPWTGYLHDIPADPLIMGTQAFVSSAYQRGAALIDFSGWKVKVIWDQPRLISNLESFVYFDGLIYGNSNPAYNPGDKDAELFCMEAATGKKLWTLSKGLGSVISVGRYLIRLGQNGEVSVGLRDPKGFTQTAGFRLSGGTFITPPAFSNGRLFCRSLSGKLVCINLQGNRPEKPAPPVSSQPAAP